MVVFGGVDEGRQDGEKDEEKGPEEHWPRHICQSGKGGGGERGSAARTPAEVLVVVRTEPRRKGACMHSHTKYLLSTTLLS